jgi:hypothetical protein
LDQRDGLFARVDQIWVLLAWLGVPSHAQDAVFALENDLCAGGQKSGGGEGHTDTQVNVHAVFEFLGCALDDAFAFLGRLG